MVDNAPNTVIPADYDRETRQDLAIHMDVINAYREIGPKRRSRNLVGPLLRAPAVT
jgi:hypothetical protein